MHKIGNSHSRQSPLLTSRDNNDNDNDTNGFIRIWQINICDYECSYDYNYYGVTILSIYIYISLLLIDDCKVLSLFF